MTAAGRRRAFPSLARTVAEARPPWFRAVRTALLRPAERGEQDGVHPPDAAPGRRSRSPPRLGSAKLVTMLLLARARPLVSSSIALSLLLCAPTACSRAAPSGGAVASNESAATARAPDDGRELIGTVPGEWEATSWRNSPPLTLAGLRGRVVLARWWTAGCPYCEATAPALREFDRDYRERGLVVIGFYHHKDEGPLDEAVVDRTAARYGFVFPVAVDPEWRTLDRWWQPREKKRAATSVSFLLDKHGVVRHVHPGGEYAKGDPAYDAMKSKIEALLVER
jgi:peroxiredoxin